MSIDQAAAIPAIAVSLDASLTAKRREGFQAILTAWQADPRAEDLRQLAYILATAWHETAFTMQPVGEYGGDAYKTLLYDVTGKDPDRARRNGNTEPGDGVKYAGKGYVQLTWKNNYVRAGTALGIDLVARPERALEPSTAAKIIVSGMIEGWFTGRKLSSYIFAAGADYRNARRIVNGLDKADQIAGYARKIAAALRNDRFPTLREGAKGDAVKLLQQALVTCGVTADGDFGPQTKRAVAAFQKAHELEPDGVVGPRTWDALSILLP